MKRFSLNLRCHRALLISFFAAIALPAAVAQTTYYWEPDATPNDGTLDGGAGTWNSTNAFFTTSATDSGTAIAWPTGTAPNTKNTVIFGGTIGGTVTLSALTAYTPTGGNSTTTNQLLNNLTFATTGYTLTGNTIRFVYTGTTNGSITVNSGVTATINSAISGGTTSGLSNPSAADITNGTTDGKISNNVLINGGGTLNLGGGNGSLGFTIDAATTVQVTAGTFSGFNLNTINNGSILRPTAGGVLSGPSSYQTTAGAGTLDINGISQTIANLGGALAVTNSTSTASTTLNLTLAGNILTHTGVISNGTGKISLATTGTVAQGNGFSSTSTFSTQTFAGANTYTGSTSLGRGTVTLDFSNAAAPASNILYNTGFGTPTGDDGKLLIARPLGTVGVANSAIGSIATLTLTGKTGTANSQQFNGLKITGGAANFLLNPGATGGNVTLDFGSTLERSAGSVINFATTNATTALSSSATINSGAGTASTVLKDANGVAFAVIGGRDWAAKNATNTSIVSASTAGAASATVYTNSTPTGFTANADITTPTAGAAANDTRLSADTTISTLRYGNSSNRTGIHLGGNTLTTGGILTSQDLNNSGTYLTGGTVTSPGASGSDIVLYSNSQTIFGLGAVLADGTAATGFTKGGSGIVLSTANNTFAGSLTVNEGGLILTGTNTASGININGSQTNLLGAQLLNLSNTAGAFVQLGNANALGSLGTGNVNLGVNGLLAIKRTDSLTLNNNVLGTGGLTQGWSGTTTLLSAAAAKYTYVGDTTVTAGTLKLDYAASDTGILPDNTRLALGGGTVEYATAAGTANNDHVRDTVLLSGGSTLTKTGAGAGRLRLNSINSFGAGSTLNLTANSIADTDSTNTNGIIGTTARITVGSAGTYNWGVNSTNAGDGAINGLATYAALGLAAGSDTTNSLQDLTGTTSFTGSRTTNTLKLTNTSGSSQSLDIVAGNTLTLTTGGLLVTGTNEVQINNGSLRSNSATASDLIIHQYSSGGLVINSAIVPGTGTTTLTKTGNGPLTLGGTNTYTGVTYLNGGVTSISSNANLGAVASGGSVFLNNGTLKVTADVNFYNGSVGTNNRAFGLSGVGGTIEVDSTRTAIIAGAITGPGGLTKTGNGTLDIRNASGYAGPTTVTAGTLKFGAAANPTRSDVTVGASGTLDIGGFGNTVGSLAGAGIVTNTGATATLNVGALPTDTTFSGQLTNTTNALNLDKWGAGTLTLTGATHNYTGTTTISGGTLALSGAGVLPDTTAVNVSSAAGTFDISGITGTSETIRTLAGMTASSVVLGARNLAIADDFGTVSVTASTAGGTSITVASVPSYLTVGSALLGRTVTGISGTTITLNGAANIDISTPTGIPVYPATSDTTFAGVISGAGGTLTKDGTGNLTLAGANTYTGQTTVDRGVLTVTNASGLGTTAGGTRINYNGNTSGGRLDITGGAGSITIDETITLAGGRFGNNYTSGFRATGGTVNLTNALILEGTTNSSELRLGTENASTVLNLQAGVTRTGGPTGGGLLLFRAGGNSTINFNGAIDNNGGTVEFTDGTAVLNVASTEVGNLQIDYNGTVKLGVDNAFPAASQLRLGLNTGSTSTDNAAVVGTLDMAGYNLSVARLEGSNAAATTATTANRKITNSSSGNSVLTIGAATGNATFDGVIENGSGGGTVALTKTGANTQTLSGTAANTYSGATNISGTGSLILNNSISSTSSVTVNTGASLQLGAADRINDAAAINLNGGTLLTGGFNESVGILTLTGDNVVDLGAGSSVLQFANSSSATWGSTLTVWNWTGNIAGGGTDQILFGTSSSGLTSGQVANVSFLNPAGFAAGTYGATLLGSGELVPVPEPTALGSAALAMAAALRRRRR